MEPYNFLLLLNLRFMFRSEGGVDSETNVVDDARKKSDDGADGIEDAATIESNSTDTEMTPTKKASRTFSQLESESAAAPV